MKGGKTLFFLDMVQMNLDSIPMGGTYAFGYDLNLSDLLFKYGIRANMDLVQDTQSGKILLNVGNLGDRANLQAIPFPYYVVLNTFGKHPIVRNLNGVYGRFLGTLDTVRADGIKKTPLIFSNKYSKIKKIPNMISLDELRADLNPKLYNRQFLPVSYLLEGKFQSLYKNRFPPDSVDSKSFLADGKANKMIVCADGDLITNEIDRKTGKILPLGTESVDKLTYSNKDFILNALSYLLDEDGLIMTRNNEITLRPLDKFKIQEEKLYWQTINLLFPVILVVVFGIVWFFVRKKRYENF
jgi:gliding-associated putative ABC transporter substrate-binding component GldG